VNTELSATAALAHREIIVRLPSTPRQARLARHAAVEWLAHEGCPAHGRTASAVAAIVAEFAANAVTHGRAPGRHFELRLVLGPDRVRVEVADARPEARPPAPGSRQAPPLESSGGRGLLLVEALADRWGCTGRNAFSKIIWAEVARQEHVSES
jgi:anti-sigma regulatory factor (Ser/Thr protein kinase)